MATVKVKFRPMAADSRRGKVFYQVIHKRLVRQISTDYTFNINEWNGRRGNIEQQLQAASRTGLTTFKESIMSDLRRFRRVISDLSRGGDVFGADDVIDAFVALCSRLSLFRFIEENVARLKCIGKERTAEIYRSTLNSVRRFSHGKDILMDDIDSALVESYGAYLRGRGLIPNTVSYYMRILRAVYNRACEEGIVEAVTNPFRHVYTGVDKTVKRALGIADISRIRQASLSSAPFLDYARDMFMMSFYLRGMSFVDLAYLKKSDVRSGKLSYRRRKTGQALAIRWTPEMQAIVDKYPPNPTEYLLPIIVSSRSSPRNQYRSRQYLINRHLKEVGRRAGVKLSLTMYVARHSWASIAKLKGVPIGVISEGLGHDREQTTQIYLATLDTSAVDRANDLIISSL